MMIKRREAISSRRNQTEGSTYPNTCKYKRDVKFDEDDELRITQRSEITNAKPHGGNKARFSGDRV